MKSINFKYFKKDNFYKAIDESPKTLKKTLFKKKHLHHLAEIDDVISYYVINEELYYTKKRKNGPLYLKNIIPTMVLHDEYNKLKIDANKSKLYSHGYVVINSIDDLKKFSDDDYVYANCNIFF